MVLLIPELCQYAVSAAHRVEDLYGIISNGIIENFNRISRPVETNEYIFVIIPFQFVCVDSGLVSVMNVIHSYAMFERRWRKNNFHFLILAYIDKKNKRKNTAPKQGGVP